MSEIETGAPGSSSPGARAVDWLNQPELVTDDTGRQIAFRRAARRSFDPLRLGALLRAWLASRRTNPGPARDDARAAFRSLAWHVLLRLFIAGLALAGSLLFFSRLAPRLGFAGWMIPVGVVALLIWFRAAVRTFHFVMPWTRRRLRALYRDAAVRLLRSGRCGACQYPLTSLAPGADGLTTCPECSARWRFAEWWADEARAARPAHLLRHPERGRSIRATDARSRVWPLFAGRPLAEARRLTRENSRSRYWRVCRWDAAALGVLGASLGVTYLPVVLTGRIANPGALYFLSPSALCAIVIAGMRIGEIRSRRAREVVTRTVKAGICPHCENALRTRPAHSDGALVCDRCGAAWSAPDTERRP